MDNCRRKAFAIMANRPFQSSNFILSLLSSLLGFRFLSIVGGSADQIGSAELRQCVESRVRSSSVEELAKMADTTPETLGLIIDGLTQPPGFDIRQSKLTPSPALSHTHTHTSKQRVLRQTDSQTDRVPPCNLTQDLA